MRHTKVGIGKPGFFLFVLRPVTQEWFLFFNSRKTTKRKNKQETNNMNKDHM